MQTLVVRDLQGHVVGYLDGETLRDENGKPFAVRSGKDADALTLADRAARWMDPRSVLMANSSADLSPFDVSTPATQAEYGIPSLDCIADRVSAPEYVKHLAGVAYAENVSDAVQEVRVNADIQGRPLVVNPGYTPVNFTTKGYAVASMIPRLVANNADFDLKERATRRIVEALRLAREVRLAKLLTTAATFATGNQVGAGVKWNGLNPSPLADTFGALATSYLPANAIVLSEDVVQYYFAAITTGRTVRDFVQAGGQLPTPIVARAKVLSGGSLTYVWGGASVNVPLVRIAEPNLIPTTRTFRWLGDDGIKGERRAGMLVRTFFDPKDDAEWIVVAHNDAETIVSNQVGAVITGAIA